MRRDVRCCVTTTLRSKVQKCRRSWKIRQYQIFNICITRFQISIISHISWTEILYSLEIKLYGRMTNFYWFRNVTEYFWERRRVIKWKTIHKCSLVYTSGAMSAASAVSATFSRILLCLETDRAWKYVVAIFHKFSAKRMRFQMQSTNLLKILHNNVELFLWIGHFPKSACFDVRIPSCLRLFSVICIRGKKNKYYYDMANLSSVNKKRVMSNKSYFFTLGLTLVCVNLDIFARACSQKVAVPST